MPPLDPILVQDTRDWLLKAYEDLDSASVLMRQSPARINTAAFHAQQAAEKTLKAFLIWKEKPFRKIHDLIILGKACVASDPTLAESIAQVTWLTDWATETRYPGNRKSLTRSEVAKALRAVRKLFRETVSRLPREIQL